MSDTTINIFGNIMLKSVKMDFSDNTKNLNLKKSTYFFHGVQNSFCFSNWYSRNCTEPF